MAHPVPVDERLEWIDEREAWRKTLPDPPVPDFLTGLQLRYPDPRDFQMPSAEERGIVGLPDNADLSSSFPGPVLNQGAIPSCVSHTLAHQQCIFQYKEERIARVFDAPRAHNETGPQNQGRWPDDVLKYCKDRGMPLSGSEQRYRITSYAFAPKHSVQAWTDAIKAAIASGNPVPICYLLPSMYGAESSGEMTSGYHETLIVGYRPDAFLMLNSWGTGWGRSGYGWVGIPFLTQSNFQNGYVIAHSSVTDETTVTPPTPNPPNPPDPPIPPNPVIRVTVSGEAKGGGLEFIQAGQVLSAANGIGFSGTIGPITVNKLVDPTPPIPPNPPIPPTPVGELVIEATPNGTGWWAFRVRDGASYVNAKVSIDLLPGQEKLTQRYGAGRAVAATFWLGQHQGKTATATARELAGSRTGQLTFTA